MVKEKLKFALNKACDFIHSLEFTNERSIYNLEGVFFSMDGEGTVFLDSQDTARYVEILKMIISADNHESISPKAVEKLFQKAILTSIDINEKRTELSFDRRIEIALEEMQRSLKTPPISHSVYYPVHGLDIDGLPLNVGNVEFCVFDDEHLSKFLRSINEMDQEKISTKITFADLKNLKSWVNLSVWLK